MNLMELTPVALPLAVASSDKDSFDRNLGLHCSAGLELFFYPNEQHQFSTCSIG